MASFLRMSGQQATVYWGHQIAAELGPWTLEFGCLRATIRSANPIRVTQVPLWFTIDNSAAGRPNFERRLLDCTVSGEVLTARLGPKKV
jgi:hypothetical protein